MITKIYANGSLDELKQTVLALNLRHSCIKQPVTRVLNGADGNAKAMSLGVSVTGNNL